VHDDAKEHEAAKNNFVLALNEEDFKAKDADMHAELQTAKVVP
jgi:hypothetical protein